MREGKDDIKSLKGVFSAKPKQVNLEAVCLAT